MMKLVWSRSMWALIEPRCFNNFGWVRNQTLVTLSSFNQKDYSTLSRHVSWSIPHFQVISQTVWTFGLQSELNWETVGLCRIFWLTLIRIIETKNSEKNDKRHLVNMTQNEFNIFKIFKKLLRTRYQAWIFPGRTRSSKRTWSTIYVKNL